jgi:hypothetical protein
VPAGFDVNRDDIRSSRNISLEFVLRLFDHQVNVLEQIRRDSFDEGRPDRHHGAEATIHDIEMKDPDTGPIEPVEVRGEVHQVGSQHPDADGRGFGPELVEKSGSH